MYKLIVGHRGGSTVYDATVEHKILVGHHLQVIYMLDEVEHEEVYSRRCWRNFKSIAGH